MSRKRSDGSREGNRKETTRNTEHKDRSYGSPKKADYDTTGLCFIFQNSTNTLITQYFRTTRDEKPK